MPIKGYRIEENSDSIFTDFGHYEDEEDDSTPVERVIRQEPAPKKTVTRRGFLGALGATAAGAVAAKKIKAGPRSSFDQVEAPVTPPKPKGREYIINSTQPDKFTIVRKRELLTPSRCTVQGCQFDIAKKNGFPQGWHTVPQRERRLMLDALQEHIKIAHNRSEDYILAEEFMPKRWLSAERGLKDMI